MLEHTSSAGARRGTEWVLCRALLTSYLVTGNLEEAEQAVLKGIDSWNGDVEPEEVLLRRVITAAAQATPHEGSHGRASRLSLPPELEAVLTLAPTLRGCYVMRNLAGMPSQACAQLLRLLPEQVDEYTGAAHQELAAAYQQ